ncbi:hypothetical protein O0L34_g16744 [Tuta absoluta]|nr:hypothetical protein O0L34_g16744 [Tuta absoluta]
MFYEVLIGFGVLLFLIWRYLLSTNKEIKLNSNGTSLQNEAIVEKSLEILDSESKRLKKDQRAHKSAKLESEPLIKAPLKKEIQVYESHELQLDEPSLKSIKEKLEIFKSSTKQEVRESNVLKYFGNDAKESQIKFTKTVHPLRPEGKENLISNELIIEKYFAHEKEPQIKRTKLPPITQPKITENEINNDLFRISKDVSSEPRISILKTKDINDDIKKRKKSVDVPALENFARIQNIVTVEPVISNIEIDITHNQNESHSGTSDRVQKEDMTTSTNAFVNKDIITPSLLLKNQQEKAADKVVKRESPPKERLAEFLEKTIFSDDKIQSIIQNLSLDKTETAPVPAPNTESILDLVTNDIEPEIKETISERAAKLQLSIDQTADRIIHLENANVSDAPSRISPGRDKELKQNELIKTKNEINPLNLENENTECDGNIEDIPLLKRIQKQAGVPMGLNFGSLIGELKSKTKNGGLKPVFKKFESDDSVDSLDSADEIQENLNAAVDDKKKVAIEENELGPNILADRRNKLETAAQGWRKRVPQNDANLFTVAGRLERDKVNITPPLTPPPVQAPPTPLAATPTTPGVPALNKFRSRKQNSPTNGFASGPLRSASCAVVSAAAVDTKPIEKEPVRNDRESFKRSHSVSESISRLDEKEELSPGQEKSGCAVRVPRADDETFQAFFAPLSQQEKSAAVDVDLDAIDSGSRQLLASDWARRAKRERRHVASRNPLKALAARTDIKEEYVALPSTLRDQLIKEKATANCGLAAEALAALASKEDFSNVALRSASATNVPSQGTKSLMLLQVKGRRRVQTRLVEPVHGSVNRGDAFVLVTPDQVFLYIGLYANVIERNRSTDIASHIHTTKDLGCKNSTAVIVIDEQTNKHSNKHWNQFWTLLGLTDNVQDYRPAETGHPDEDEIYESCIVQTNMCYEVMDDELVPIKEYWGQMPKISMLNQAKTIVFDYGSEMYIWYGKNVPLESRRRAAQLAQELFDEGYNYEECHINPLNAAEYQGVREIANSPPKAAKSRPEWAILSKVTQHMETILFKEKFLDWPDYTRVIKVKPQENKSNSTELTPCDAEEMWSNEYQDPDLILEGSHIGRGTSYYDKESMRHYNISTKSVSKWVIQEFDYQKIENEAEMNEFFSGDSYIIRWEYQITVTGRELNGKPSKHNLTGRDRCAYFCWQGKDASSNDKGAAALLTVELDKEKGPQVRVSQGNEPPAFLNLFQGNLVVHSGKKNTDKSRYRLFVTRGNLSNEAYLLQVPCSVRQLRSRGSLLLADTEKGSLYIWHGSRSLKHTKNIAIELANKLIARKSDYLFGSKATDIKITEVKESEEPKEVLEALGVANKQHYNSVLSASKEAGADTTPRLFHFTDLGGQFEAHEVLSPLRHEHLVTPFPFEQRELYAASQPALFMLDDGVSVWLWQGWWPRGEDGELEPAERNTGVGAFAARWQGMRAAALRTCEAYWSASRGTRPNVRVVASGLEPQSFSDLFDTWAEDDEAAEANIAHGYKAGEILSGACELSRLTACDAILPLAALQRRPLPDHVDPHHLERHLSSPDFLEAFGMSKEDFSGLPAWKQTNMKKDIGLF